MVVFQKAYWVNFASAYKGIKILDLCDGDWLFWNYDIVQTLEHVDAVTCSTMEIAKFIVGITDKPVWVIPDRIDFADLVRADGTKRWKEHTGELKKAVWFGYAHNFSILNTTLRALQKRDIELIVVANDGFIPPF